MDSELRVSDLTVTWRHCLDLGGLEQTEFTKKEALEKSLIEARGAAAPDAIYAAQRGAGARVCGLVAHRCFDFALPAIEVARLDRVEDLSNDVVAARAGELAWMTLRASVLLHHSGVALVRYTARFAEPRDVRTAIRDIRLDLDTLVIRTPAGLAVGQLDASQKVWVRRIADGDGRTTWVALLRDFTAHVVKDVLRATIGPLLQAPFEPVRSTRVLTSTLIEVDQLDPACPDLGAYSVAHGRALRGIATRDLAYTTRAPDLVAAALRHNVSQDEELGLFLFGQSDLLVYTELARRVLPVERARLGLADDYAVARYIAAHYASLLEWVHIEQYLIELYDRLLTRSMTRDLLPEDMLSIQRRSMQDLVEYGEGVTAFATRAAFREHARDALGLGDKQERLEKKRDMVADYVMQKYSLRTNRGIQMLNLVISATIAFELMQLAMQIVASNRPVAWTAASAVVFAGFIFAFVRAYRTLERRR